MNVIYAVAGQNFIEGTESDDTIIVDVNQTFTIDAKGGNDTIIINTGGNHIITAGTGDDQVFLYGGNRPEVYGQEGNDQITAKGANSWFISAGSGFNIITVDGYSTIGTGDGSINPPDSGSGPDVPDVHVWNIIRGGSYNGSGSISRIVNGDRNNNNFSTGSAADTLNGGGGNDTLRGNEGNDVLNGGPGNDFLNGGDGVDTLEEAGDFNFVLTNTSLIGNGSDSLSSIETAKITGGANSNSIDASAFTLGSVTLFGEAGNDNLEGGTKSDTLVGGQGNDTLSGGAGKDTVEETGNSNFVLTNTTLRGNGNDALNSIEEAIITGGSNNNSINASEFNLGSVTLFGKAGNDNLRGGTKNDTLTGGEGNDTLTGGPGNDRLIFESDLGIDRITDFVKKQ